MFVCSQLIEADWRLEHAASCQFAFSKKKNFEQTFQLQLPLNFRAILQYPMLKYEIWIDCDR